MRVSPMLSGSLIKHQDDESWGLEKEFLPPADTEPTEGMTPWELDRIADAILWQDIQAGNRHFFEPAVLMYEHLNERRRREIYVKSGTPDAALMKQLSPDGQFIYWRTRPDGRKVNSEDQRKRNGASFYR